MKIILDTNFLVNCAKFHIDYESELKGNKLFLLDKTLRELEKLINQKKAKHAKLALEILMEKPVKILKTRSQKSVDSILAQKKGYAIATADKKLKEKLKLKGKKIFIIRQKKYVKEI